MKAFFTHERQFWQADAEIAPLMLPTLEVVLDLYDHATTTRTLTLKVSSPRHAACVAVWEESTSFPQQIVINGERAEPVVRFSEDADAMIIDAMLGSSLRSWEVRFCNIPDAGISITAHLKDPEAP